ncbi:dihydrolipoamide acetyltransferase family protein [Gordonia sp. (in: high G+C Gram-positive bacteria)]|uniref:dihydrolipoamide acetyltransferase family protein n=1 Tax=Gordonia sp. (in: high G+C Gram-positive bacteria) TaxID=84139 RepID=UPI003C72446B
MSVISTFNLPDLGEGLTDADLVRWEVAVGDTIELNQVIAEVETAKAAVELPSPYAGTVVKLHAEPGDTVEVGSPFIDVEMEGEAAAVEPVSETEPAAERTPVLVGYGVAQEEGSRRKKRSALASPPVRKLAREAGVDLAAVVATGSSGQVTRDDLDAHLGRVEEPTAPAELDNGAEERTPIRGVRKHTAEAMVQSAFTAPHVTEFVDVDVTPMMDLLDKLASHSRLAGVRLTPLTMVAKALLVALRTNESLNSTWDEQAQEIVTKHYVNLGIAAATPRGLMVPNIKDADRLSLRQLASALSELTAVAKEGTTPPSDLVGGTITITNIGVFGIDSGTPILNPGEAAILCFGAVRRRPWEWEGEIALRQVTTLSLSFDHRLVDGEEGSRFLATVADVLSDPLSLIALS